MNNLLKVIAKNVRRERNKQKLSQEKLATLADFHRTYIGMVERAERNLSVLNLERIAQALQVEIIELLQQDEPEHE